jgi:F-type H+-transporting ATPase subunit b
MEATLYALGQILLRAVPTFFLVLLLYVYLRFVFFKPMAGVLARRYELTEGARQSAAHSLETAAHKAADYEESLRAARNEIYREQEEIRRQWRDEQAARVAEARKRAEAMVKEARADLARQAQEARLGLEAQVRELATRITEQVLAGAAR